MKMRSFRFLLMTVAVLLVTTVQAQQGRQNGDELLDEKEYRSELEEIVVVGQEPEWRKKIMQKEEWRPESFKLGELTDKAQLQWFPEYTKDERDNYQGVHDRSGEKPEFQLFKWKF